MAHPLLAIPIIIPFILISMAFGRMVLTLLGVKSASPTEHSIFGLGIGLGTMAYLILASGLAGILYSWTFILIPILMLTVSIKETIRLIREVTASAREQAKSKLKPAESFVILGMVALGALAIIPALAPSSGLDWDGLAYHLAIPKLYLAKHSIHYVPFISHSNFPFLTEMLYTIGVAFGSTGIAKLFHYTMYIGTAVAIYSLCARHLNSFIGRISVLIFMSVPVIMWEAGVAYTDLSTALYITLAIYAVLNWEKTNSTPWLVVCGIMGGFALGTKVLAGVPIVLLCVWILLASGVSKEWGRGFKLAFCVGIISLLVGSPWYIKSYLYTGNPFYPFLYNIFGGKYWSQGAADAYRGSQLAFGMGREFTKLIMAPWNLVAKGVYFFDIPNPANPKVWGLIGPAFLGLIPVYILNAGKNKTILKIGILSAVFVLSWFILMQYSRYMITIIPMLCIIAAAGVDIANRKFGMAKFVVNGFVAICVTISIITGLVFSLGTSEAAFGTVSDKEYLSKTLDVYDTETYINDNLTEDARIAIFDEVRGFYLDREYIWANPGHHEMIPWSSFKSGKEMVDYFLKENYRYAMINWNTANENDLHQRLIIDALSHGLFQEIYASKNVAVYELRN
ncbi:MAG: ArnT family glycosyltransferase [Armatimonadota bacterium]